MANPKFPDVPIAIGVPPVFRDPGNPPLVDLPPLTADDPVVVQGFRDKWGIYTAEGAVALEVDSVVAVEPQREARLADYITEDGGFQSYNKVQMSGEARVTVTKGGSAGDRRTFLSTLDEMVEGIDLFTIVMPDFTLTSRAITRYDYSRQQDRGATLLIVDITLMEVRQTAVAAFTDSKEASGNKVSTTGPVQAQPATTAQTPAAAPPSTNPAVQAIPVITPAMPQPQRAATVTRLIEAGATVGDLVTKGASFLAVPTVPRAAQSLVTQLGGQSVRLNISQKSGGLFTDVFVNGVLKVGGALVQNDNPLLRSGYLGFAGDLIFHDTQAGLGAPTFRDLGGRVALLYAGA